MFAPNRSNGLSQQKRRGFTLIELMVTLVIVAILASIALPSYQQHVIRGRRSGAKAAMMDLANREQQYLLANRTYADTTALTALGYTPPTEVSSYYSWAVSAPTSTTFTITFTPTGAQASDGALTLDQAGDKTPAAKWQQ